MVAEAHGHSVADDVLTDPLLRRGASYSNELATTNQRNMHVRRAPNSAGLYDVLDLILDKGMVIDAFVRVSLVGIELLTVDLRVVIASVDTYLRYAEGAERLQLYKPRGGEDQLPDMMGMNKESGGAGGMMLRHGAKKLKKSLTGDKSKDGGGEEEGVGDKLAHGVRHVLTNGVGRVMGRLAGQERDDSRDPGRGGNGKHARQRDKPSKRDRARARDR